MLRRWNYTIDILIVAQTHVSPDDSEYTNVHDDPVFLKLGVELRALSRIARDVVLLPNVQFTSDTSAFTYRWRRTIVNGGSLEIFKSTVNVRSVIFSFYQWCSGKPAALPAFSRVFERSEVSEVRQTQLGGFVVRSAVEGLQRGPSSRSTALLLRCTSPKRSFQFYPKLPPF